MPDLLVARTSAVVALGRRRVRIRKGVTIVNADDSFVRGRENLFEPLDVPYIGGGDASKRRGAVVEDASQEPGASREVTLSPGGETPAVPDADTEPEGTPPAPDDASGAADAGSEPSTNTEEQPPEPEQESAPEPSAKEVRAWCKDKDIDVPARGRIPDEVMAAYRRAHGGGW